ncbi:MAG: hypothetical protein A2173_08115 [Planctomycetes bacterium RBG_13_44_8b]|nr:MAG: hypothetical protein A2173_08115 [Planctomycetes bacterium RBG_13_44_8b]
MIIDPVHGDIGLSKLETEIINTPTFQRLRRLKQLGFASFVYPSASYNRFSHSLGVLYLSSRVAEVFRRKDLVAQKDIRKLRLAALLHDIGHYPYSHLMEFINLEGVSPYLQRKNHTHPKNVLKRYPSHDKLGKLIVTKRKDISKLLKDNKIDPKEIAAIIAGEHPEIPNILHRSLDVDRLDYLVRDAHNTGLPYGRVDINYIINNLEISANKEMVLKSKARLSAEHLLLSRYFMFNAVYFHKTVFGFEELVRKTIVLLMRHGEIYAPEQIEEMVVENSDKFLKFDDSYLDNIFDKYASLNNNNILNILCAAIKYRHPPKLVYEVTDLTSGQASEEYTKFHSFLLHHLKSVTRKKRLNSELIFWAEPRNIRFEALNPFMSLSKIAQKAFNEAEIGELVKLVTRDGKIINLVEDEKSIIYHLGQLNVKSIRLYAIGINDKTLNSLKREMKRYISN